MTAMDRAVVVDEGDTIRIDIYPASSGRRLASVALDTSAAIEIMARLDEAISRRYAESIARLVNGAGDAV